MTDLIWLRHHVPFVEYGCDNYPYRYLLVRLGGISSSCGLALDILARLCLTKTWTTARLNSPDKPTKRTKKIGLCNTQLKWDYLFLPFLTEAASTLHGTLTNLTELHARMQNASRRLDFFGKDNGSFLKDYDRGNAICVFSFALYWNIILFQVIMYERLTWI